MSQTRRLPQSGELGALICPGYAHWRLAIVPLLGQPPTDSVPDAPATRPTRQVTVHLADRDLGLCARGAAVARSFAGISGQRPDNGVR